MGAQDIVIGSSRFHIRRRLGEGGMGVVYEAFDDEREGVVALKTLRVFDAEARLRLKTEFRALQDIQHPNLVQLGELIEAEGQLFFTMELVQGVDFLSYVRKDEPLGPQSPSDAPTAPVNHVLPVVAPAPRKPGFDEPRLRAALAQLSRGLFALHAAGKVHRDIKPSNILVTDAGRVVLLDFGLVEDVARQKRSSPLLAGTAAFMAPEQSLPDVPAGPACDWYSVGVVLYLALTGRLPFDGPAEVMQELKQRIEPPVPSLLCANVPRDFEELCMELLRPIPTQRPDGREVMSRLHVEQSTEPASLPGRVFVGRRDELAELRTAFEDSRRGGAVTVLVHGESGIGKSMLLRQLAHELAAAPAPVLVLAGRCYERESVPYKALDEVIDALSRHLAELPKARAAELVPERAHLIAQAFPVLRRVGAIATQQDAEVLDQQQVRALLFASLRELLGRLAAQQPLVIMIDDLQWADADSLALLDDLRRGQDAPAFLLVASVRTAASDARLVSPDDLRARLPGDVRTVALGRLSQDDARELLGRLASGLGEVEDAIVGEAQGHPLFIDTLVRHRALTGHTAASLHLDDALWSRAERLEPGVRRVLELIAVAGGPLLQSIAAEAAGLDLRQFEKAAALLRTAHLAYTSGARRIDPIDTYHDRVRETVLARLDEAERRFLHRRLASALELSGDADPEALAVHWREAGRSDHAASYALQAAAQAARALAFDRAARLYRLALEIHPPDGAERLRILTLLGDTLAHGGRGAEAAAAYLEAAALTSGDDAVDLRRRAAQQLVLSGRVDEALAAFEDVLEAIGMPLAPTPRRALIRLLLRRAGLRLRGLRYVLRKADEIPPAELTRVDLCFSVAAGLSMIDIIRGAEFQTRHIRLALRAGEASRLARAFGVEASLSSARGPSGAARAERMVEESRRLAESSGDNLARAWALGAAAMTAMQQGQWALMRKFGFEADKLLRERCTGVAWELATMQAMLLYALVNLGELREVERFGERWLREAEERGDLYAVTTFRAGPLTHVHLAHDRPDHAWQQTHDAMARWSSSGFHLQHYYHLLSVVQIGQYRRDFAGALRELEQVAPVLKASLLLRVQGLRVFWLAARARIRIGLAGQRSGSEREHLLELALRDARSLFRERVRHAEGMALSVRGGVATTRGDLEAALPLYAEAVRVLESGDMMLQAAASRWRHGRLLGGDEGAQLVAAAEATMRAQGVLVPAALVNQVAPGD